MMRSLRFLLSAGLCISTAISTHTALAEVTKTKNGVVITESHQFENKQLPRRGSFGTKPLVGFYDFKVEDNDHRQNYFGLSLDGAWPYGGIETESGKRYLLLRKITRQTTNYLIVQRQTDKGYVIDREVSMKAQAGGTVKRRVENSRDVYAGSAGPGGPGFRLEVGEHEFSWVENGIMSLKGKRVTPAWHVYTPWREDNEQGRPSGGYYSSVMYLADGEIFGEKASGFFILDQNYQADGIDWNANENQYWSRLQEAWMVFATEWDDGTIEWGHFAQGKGHFQFGSVADNKNGVVLDTTQVDMKVELPKTDGFSERVVYSFPGSDEQWEFVTLPVKGPMIEGSAYFSLLNNVQWYGQSGIMRRVGETRKPVRHIAWQELFNARLLMDDSE